MSYSFKISLISLKSKVIITPYSKKYATFLLYTGLIFLGGLCNSEPDGKGIATLSIVSSKVVTATFHKCGRKKKVWAARNWWP